MKKKKGAALIWVLMISTILIITCTAVMFLITNANRIDNNSNTQSNLRIEAYTGINLGQYYLVNEENYRNLESKGSSIKLNTSEVSNISSKLGVGDLRKAINKYNLELTFENLGDNEYKIISVAKLNGQSYTQDKIVKTTDTINLNINNFLNSISGISILGENTGLNNFQYNNVNQYYYDLNEESNYTNSTENSMFNNIGINIKGINSVENVVNEANGVKGVDLSLGNCKRYPIEGESKSNGLDLNLATGNLIITAGSLANIENNSSLSVGMAYLIENGNITNQYRAISNLSENNLGNVSGVLAKIGEDKWCLINNGNIILNCPSNLNNTSANINNTIIYSTEYIRFDGLNGTAPSRLYNLLGAIEESFYQTGTYSQYINELKNLVYSYNTNNYNNQYNVYIIPYTFIFNNSDIVANKGIEFLDAQMQLNNQFSDPSNNDYLKKCLEQLVKQ